MKGLKNRILTLKGKLIEEPNLSQIMKYFFDKLADDPEFMKIGRPLKGKWAEEVRFKIAAALNELFKRQLHDDESVPVSILTQIEKYHFIHGYCNVQGKAVMVLFFSDISKGMLAAPYIFDNANTEYIRFGATFVPEERALPVPCEQTTKH